MDLEEEEDQIVTPFAQILATLKDVRSNLAKMLLQQECKESGHYPKVIPQANETRWDSRYSNMMGVLYHQDCLMRLARKGKLKVKKDKRVVSLIPTMEEFLLIDAGAEVIKVCQDTTKVFEQEARPTLPLVVERLYTMDWKDDENQKLKLFKSKCYCNLYHFSQFKGSLTR